MMEDKGGVDEGAAEPFKWGESCFGIGKLCWFQDIEFAHTGAQGASIEPEEFRCAFIPADFPLGLFKYLNNIVSFNGFQRFVAGA